MIPTALLDLLKSEKAFAGGILVIAATVFVCLNRMSIEQWQEFVTWVFGIYAAGKTSTAIAATLKGSNATEPVAPEPKPEPANAPA